MGLSSVQAHAFFADGFDLYFKPDGRASRVWHMKEVKDELGKEVVVIGCDTTSPRFVWSRQGKGSEET